MGLDLVTLDEYKIYAGINSTNQDTVITALIPQVSSLVKTICRRTFVDYVDDAKTEVFSGGSTNSKYYMQEYPVISVSSVEYSADYGQTYDSLVEFTDYVVDLEDDSLVALPYTEDPSTTAVFTKAINGYKVSYYAGYEVLPEDLKIAILDLVTYYLKNDGSVHSPKAPGTNSVQIEYITTTALPAHIARVLNIYKASWD